MLIHNYNNNDNNITIKKSRKNKVLMVTNYISMPEFINSFSDMDVVEIVNYVTENDINSIKILIQSKTFIKNIKFVKNTSILYHLKTRYDNLVGKKI